ncbi:post-transcriptional regulator [Salibacterium halotolerans]|uniref:Post-transcriptional regulator n=1 Tax=Salibacterium halotolerans TaxID=1884432 RepID=A0A1I5UEI5_9BACI|nr:post-transcriptional regulator [Salibacterium halotolerans]SFP93675.1 Post-transcriptional regulator [Salibacterium halotolerans]
MNTGPFEVWKEDVEPALISKMEEFHQFGYTSVKKEDIWALAMKKLQKQEVSLRIHALVQAVMHLSIRDYMNDVTIASYKESASLYSSETALGELLEDIETGSSSDRHLT